MPKVEIGIGEYVDRATILPIKMDHGSDKLFKVAEWTKRQEKKYGLPSNRSISSEA